MPASSKVISPLAPNNLLHKILYDRKSAAFTLSISVRSLDYLIANKRLNTVKLGSKVMIGYGELVKFSRQHHASLTEQNSQISRE